MKAEDFENFTNKEIIQHIDELSLEEQIRLDMKLHDWYIERRPHTKKKTYLIPDKFIKLRLLDLIIGRKLEQQEIDELIYCLKLDRATHQNKGEKPRYVKWDKKWVDIYTNWIKKLGGEK